MSLRFRIRATRKTDTRFSRDLGGRIVIRHDREIGRLAVREHTSTEQGFLGCVSLFSQLEAFET